MTCETLQIRGYVVLEAGSGKEALEVCQQHPRPIHLMVTDVIMPGMSGRELAGRLATLRPEMKVLYVSGFTDDVIVHHGVVESSAAFLQKPFQPAELTRKVRALLDGDKSGCTHPRPGHPGW